VCLQNAEAAAKKKNRTDPSSLKQSRLDQRGSERSEHQGSPENRPRPVLSCPSVSNRSPECDRHQTRSVERVCELQSQRVAGPRLLIFLRVTDCPPCVQEEETTQSAEGNSSVQPVCDHCIVAVRVSQPTLWLTCTSLQCSTAASDLDAVVWLTPTGLFAGPRHERGPPTGSGLPRMWWMASDGWSMGVARVLHGCCMGMPQACHGGRAVTT